MNKQPFAMSQDEIVRQVIAGRGEFQWVDLPQHPGIRVMRDALKVDGVRVPVTAETAARLCEVLAASPTTALLEDIIFNLAEVRTVPSLYSPQTYGQWVLASDYAVRGASAELDSQILKAGKPKGLVSCVGKAWVLDNAALGPKSKGMAVNYGAHRPDGPYRSVDGRSKIWQQPSTRHNPKHWDYSQNFRACLLAPGVSLPVLTPLLVHTLWV